MKYKIESTGSLQRIRWFTNKDFGIAVQYQWHKCQSNAIFDLNFIEEGCENEFQNLIEPLLVEADRLGDHDGADIDIAYPSPYFFEEPSKAVLWDLPKFNNSIAPNFKIFLNANYIYGKSIELANANLLNRWSTLDEGFLWHSEGILPADKQNQIEHQMLAKVWISNSWSSLKDLDDYMYKEFDMQIEDDIVTFFSPTILKY
jgi:hypothetical protein